MNKLFVISLLFLMNSCVVGRFAIWNVADVKDYKKFENAIVENSDYTFNYYKAEKQFQVSDKMLKRLNFDNFETFLEKNKTTSYLIIRNDTILYEKYFNKYTDTSIVTSFSVAKSFVSALVGIAIEEKYIENDLEIITKYIPELKNSEGFNKITIRDLLDMRSGIKCEEVYSSPFNKVAILYYGLNSTRVLSGLKIEKESDKEFHYQSVNTQLLGLIVERATKQKLYNYLSEKLWKPLGMESELLWSIDSKKNDEVKAFCCMNARARDFAKFGTLYLKKGKWNGKQLIPESWINKTISFSKELNGYYYQNQWWHYPMEAVLSKADTTKKDLFVYRQKSDSSAVVRYPSNIYYAQGHLGQYIINFPDKNITIVRFGKNYGRTNFVGVADGLSYEL